MSSGEPIFDNFLKVADHAWLVAFASIFKNSGNSIY
jgi:hypothetical protein